MSCNASDGPSLLLPLLAQQHQQQLFNTQDVAALTPSAPLASSSTLAPAEPPQHTQHNYGTRTRQNSVLKPTIRALYSHNSPLSVPASAVPPSTQTPSGSTLVLQSKKEQPKHRRIRPLAACATPSSSSDDIGKHSTGIIKGILKGVKDAGRKPVQQLQPVTALPEFPPSHVVLHPDDASNKVFLSVGRAFLSVGNRAMTIKDLADLALKQGLACQNASAAAQAITFFIRSHLQRCEDEQDFPLLLRHVLSGTLRDDALVPALYSRLGGNVTHHKCGSGSAANSANANANANSASPVPEQENPEKPQERLTSFRRGTTVWYLSRAAGAPCPFAGAGIALRDYSECSGITGAESRRGAGSSAPSGSGSGSAERLANGSDEEDEGVAEAMCRGVKRKRAGLRTRSASGAVVSGRTRSDETAVVDEDVREGRKPPKVKLTLRLRPPQSCLSVVSRPVVRDEESEESDSSGGESDSDDDSEGSMDVDVVGEPTPIRTTSQQMQLRQREQLQPFTFPPFPLQRRISIPPYTPAEEDFPIASSQHRPWTSVTPSFNANGFTWGRREPSVPLSVASPPPESDDEDFDMDEEDVEDMSPVLGIVKKEEEIHFKFEWPLATSSSSSSSSPSSSATDVEVKTEDLGYNFYGTEPDDLGLSSLNLGFDSNVKVEEEDTDDLTATYMRALASVMPVHAVDDDEDAFDLESVVNRAPLSLSGWRDADFGSSVAVPITEPDFERDWAAAEVSEGVRTAWESHASVLPSMSDALAGESNLEHEDEDEDEERSSSPALTYAASSPADSSMSSSEIHDDDDDDEDDMRVNDDERESAGPPSPPPSAVPTLFFGPELRGECLGGSLMSLSRRNTPSPSPSSSLLLSRTNSATGKPRIPLPMPSSSVPSPIQQQRPPTIADTSDPDAGSAPWERGMLTIADVEAHLLPALSPTYEYPLAIPFSFSSLSPFAMSGEGTRMEPPLSPQEEEVFQSFCQFDLPSADVEGASEADNVDAPDNASHNATKRNSKILAEKEADITLEESSKPLRRSRRVANAVATQQTAAARARLRRRS